MLVQNDAPAVMYFVCCSVLFCKVLFCLFFVGVNFVTKFSVEAYFFNCWKTFSRHSLFLMISSPNPAS